MVWNRVILGGNHVNGIRQKRQRPESQGETKAMQGKVLRG